MNALHAALTAAAVSLFAGAAIANPATGIGSATPNPVHAGGTLTTTVHVYPDTSNLAAPYTVTQHLGDLGLGDAILYDDGTHGDALEGDNIYTLEIELGTQLKTGAFTIPFDIEGNDTILFSGTFALTIAAPPCTSDFNGDGDIGTDADIVAFFSCLAGDCCPTCASSDFNGDGDIGTDADIEAFFSVLGGGAC